MLGGPLPLAWKAMWTPSGVVVYSVSGMAIAWRG